MENNELIDQISDNLGLTSLQTQIIIELMRYGGQCSAPDLHASINKYSKVNRTTIYSSLEKLKREKIIRSISDHKTKIYGLVEQNPKNLVEKMKKPREIAFDNLEKILLKAEEESDHKAFNPMIYYSLSNRLC